MASFVRTKDQRNQKKGRKIGQGAKARKNYINFNSKKKMS
jgi:hypothetical protein